SGELVALMRRVAPGRELAVALLVRAHVVIPTGDLDAAETDLKEVTAVYRHNDPDGHLVATIKLIEARLATERGDFVKAHAMAAESASRPEALPLLALALLAESQARDGEPGQALDTAAALRARSAGHSPYCLALASYAEGLARHALADLPGALGCLQQAIDSF